MSCCPSLIGTRGNKMIGCNVYDGKPRGDMCMVRRWVYSVAMVYGAAACCRCNGGRMARRPVGMAIYIRTAPVWTELKNIKT